MINRRDDLDTLAKGRPYIRSLLAFVLHLRFAGEVVNWTEAHAYQSADVFIRQLERDVTEQMEAEKK